VTGQLLARYPRVEAMIGRNFSTSPIFAMSCHKADHGTTRLDSPLTASIARLCPQLKPFFPSHGDRDDHGFGRARRLAGTNQAPDRRGGFFGFRHRGDAFPHRRQLSRQHQSSRQRLMLEKERLDAAVNNMWQGLLLFDASERMVICNQRYIAMYGLSANVIQARLQLS